MSFTKVVTASSAILLLTGTMFKPCSLTGSVTNASKLPVEGAVVELAVAKKSVTTGQDGTWKIVVTSGIGQGVRNKVLPVPVLRGSMLHFAVCKESEAVNVGIFTLDGRFLFNAFDAKLGAGFYRLNMIRQPLAPATYAVRLRVGSEVTCLKCAVSPASNTPGTLLLTGKDEDVPVAAKLVKRKVVLDTLRVTKAGYALAVLPVTSYDDSIPVVLTALAPSYYLDPPNPCYNKFYVDSCIPGDPTSKCGGNCRVANSCSPPEDISKADLPKTFICPRFMLFSSAMLQAAQDDARLYGWGNGDDAPFNYGVVGHDPDVGGVDDIQSSCCQCYQIVFVKPEPSSPQPPELPYPKPLIVQSFNTAASGPKGFDVFMGAGGYGAFNSCYKDPAFGNTTKFNEFIYDEYPYQNPGSGGISFLRCQECLGSAWPPTAAALQSEACQKKIEQLCNQAKSNASQEVTDDTRRSCIETNKLLSLYHQNWEVMVKRVRCPDNLTRVTGCRLKEEKLPLPLPTVQTPDDAKTNGTFRDGYHTTTMQDCCKPTCAWTDWTVGYKLPVDGEWNSFYSCDKTGTPITK